MTKKQLIQLLANTPDNQELAIVGFYTKTDTEDILERPLTEEEWQKFAYWFSNDERLGDDQNATFFEVAERFGLTYGETA